jgi:hypothetical protein
VFAFLSGLYFRGKLTYANHFASPPDSVGGVWVITPGAGLLPPDHPVIHQRLCQFASVSIDITDQRYVQPLLVHSQRLKHEIGNDTDVILLGSIASKKYTEILSQVFGERLLFPEEFVGRGDMSRGGLMLRCVDDDRELRYTQAQGAVRTGTRPPRLIPRVVSKVQPRNISDQFT